MNRIQPPRQRTPRAWGWMALSIVLVGCVVTSSGPGFQEVLLQGQGADKILLIDLTGEISNEPVVIPNAGAVPGMVSRVRQELELAYHDPDVHGVLLRINSPGGGLTDADVIYHSLMEFKKSKKVKIVASLGDIAASGGLYVAMAADEIYAHPTTLTGSIGVIMHHMEYAGLMDKYGVTADPVTSGKFKDIESPYRKRTAEETALLQKIVNHQYEKFVAVIAQGRPKMTNNQIRAIADGRVMTSEEARQAGLIDGIQYLDDTYNRLTTLSGFPDNRLIRYANTWATGHNIYSNAFPVEGNLR